MGDYTQLKNNILIRTAAKKRTRIMMKIPLFPLLWLSSFGSLQNILMITTRAMMASTTNGIKKSSSPIMLILQAK